MNWIGLTILVLLPAIGAIVAFRSMRLLQQGVRVQGTIIDYEVVSESRENGPGYSTFLYPVVRFRDAGGKTHTVTMSASERPVAENKRKPVKVIYPKGKPEAAQIANFGSLWLLPLVFVAPGLKLAALVGVHQLR